MASLHRRIASGRVSKSSAQTRPLTASSSTAANSTPPAKNPRMDYGDVISILVGPEERLFVAHVSKLQDRSKYFKAACQGNWRESAEKVVRLPDIPVNAFQVYLDSVYGNKINFDAMRSEIIAGALSIDFSKHGSMRSYVDDKCGLLLGRLWVTADYLGDIRMQDAAVDMLIMEDDKRRITVPDNMVTMCVDGIMLDSKLTDWVVDHFNIIVSLSELKRRGGDALPKQFLLKLWTKSLEYRGAVLPGMRPAMEDRCKYHQHEPTEPCHGGRGGEC